MTTEIQSSNYVELLEAEVRRLQAEVVRLTRREDVRDGIEDVRRELAWIRASNGFHESEPETWLTERLDRIERTLIAVCNQIPATFD